MQEREGHAKPRVSAWLTGLKETIDELPAFVRVAAEIGVKEVYLQRLVFFDRDAVGLARPDQALFERMDREEAQALDAAEALAKSLGLTFSASGAASEPGLSLAKKRDDSPWSLCRRPWTVMYFTANGRALPCCIAPFSQHGYENYTLGDATQETLREIWNGPRYQSFREGLLSDHPAAGVRQLRHALEPVTMQIAGANAIVSVVIPCLDEEEPIAGVVREVLAEGVDEVIVVDNGSRDATAERARRAGARVVSEPTRGYGRACAAGVAGVRADAEIVCFLDGDGSDVPRFIADIVGPVARGEADFVMGSRLRGQREPGSMTPQQLVAGRLAGALLRARLWRALHRHVAVPRHARAIACAGSAWRETTYGWNLEMQMRVAAAGPAHPRDPGRSSLPPRRRVEGLRQPDGRPQRRLEDHHHVRAPRRCPARPAAAAPACRAFVVLRRDAHAERPEDHRASPRHRAHHALDVGARRAAPDRQRPAHL